MENDILNNIRYYVELALRRPLAAILPAIAAVSYTHLTLPTILLV